MKAKSLVRHPELLPPIDVEAVKIGELYRKAKSSIVDSMRYSVQCGLRLKAKKKAVGHGNWLRWLADNASVLQFETERTAERLIKIAGVEGAKAIIDVNVEYDETKALELNRLLWANGAPIRGTAGTGENEWFTPSEYLVRARRVLGGFDLDPA